MCLYLLSVQSESCNQFSGSAPAPSPCVYYWWVCACDLERDCGFFLFVFFVPVDMQVGLKAEILMDDDKFMFLLTKKQVFIVVFSSSGKLSFSAC